MADEELDATLVLKIATHVLDDLTDRRGIRQAFDCINDEVMDEIRMAIAEKVQQALGIPAAALNALAKGEAVVINETTGLPYLDAKDSR